VSTEEEDCFMD